MIKNKQFKTMMFTIKIHFKILKIFKYNIFLIYLKNNIMKNKNLIKKN